MANNTIKFDIKAAVDTGGLDEFVSQLRQLKDVAEPADRVLGQAVKEIKAWAEGARVSERNTTAATTAINALTSAMTAGGNEWKKGTQAANELNRSLRETVNAANAAKAALAAPARTTSGAGQQIADMRKGLQDLTIGSAQYLALLQQITEKEALLGRRTGRAGVVAANQAFEGALLTRGYGAPDRLQQMPDTTAALRQRLSELAQEFPNVIRGSERYVQIATEMRTIESQLAKDLTGTTQALRQRSAATQAKIDAVRAYNEQAIRERVVNGELNIAERRRTNFGDVPQAMRTESGVFIAPPYRSGYSGFGTMYDRPIGPQTALDYFQSRANQFPAPIGPQTPLQYWQSRTTSGAMQGPAAPTDLFRSIGGIDTAGTTAKLQTMGRSYEQVAQQIRDTAQAAGGSTRALQAERQAWEQLQASVGPATREYKQAGREMQRLDRQLGTSTRGERFLESAGAISAGAFFGGPEGLVGGLAGMAIGGPGAALGGASIGAQLGIVRKGIGDMAVYSAELGKMRIALQGVVKTQEDYARSIAIVNDATARLNIPLQESLGGFTRLAASIIGAGGSISDAEVVFRGITGALKATGKGADEVQGSITALSQIFSKGKLSAEEINQIAERLPGTFNLIAQAARKTGPGELAKALEQGQVSLNDVMRFSDSLIIKYEDSGERIAKSSEEAGARAGVALDRLREKIGQTFQPAGADLQDNIAQWANWGIKVVESIGNVYNSLRDLEKRFILSRLLSDFREARQPRPEPEPQRYGPAAPANTNDGIRSRIQQLTTRLNGLQRNSEDFKRLQGQIRALEDKLAESYSPFATPGGNEDKERKKREREEKQRLNEAAQRERLGLQLFNDEVRRQEQLAENRIRLEDRVFQYKQELMRRERDQQLQLDQLRQQTLLAGLSPEGRAAAQPIQELLQRLQEISQVRTDLNDQLAAARQDLKSAQALASTRQLYGAMYRTDDGANGGAPPATGGGSAIFGSTGNVKNAPGWVHGHFQTNTGTLQSLINDTLPVVKGLIQQGTPAELANGQRFSRGMSDEQIINLLRKGAVLHSHSGDGRSIDIFVPAGTRVPGAVLDVRGPSGRGGITGVLPGSGSSWVGHLDPASRSTAPGMTSGTTTLANNRTIRTPGAAAAALRSASSAGDVEEAQARVASLEELIKLDDKYNKQLADQSVLLAIAQSTQALNDQERALKNNYEEWQIRNRLELENVKPELIDFEVNKTRALREQAQTLEDIALLARELGPSFDKIGRGDEFGRLIAERTNRVESGTASIIGIQQQLAQAQSDPFLRWQRRMNDLGQSARDFNDTLKLAIGLSDQLSNGLAGGFSSAASSIISGNGSIQQSFADLFNNVSKMFVDTIARVMADQATSFILDLLKPAVSSIAPGPVAVANGIVPRAGFMGPGFATGGISSGPTSGYPVTLHGTEAVVPLPNGRAIPVEMKGSGSTSVVVNVNMGTGEASVSSNERDGQLLGTALSDAVQAELIRQQRPGGILYRR